MSVQDFVDRQIKRLNKFKWLVVTGKYVPVRGIDLNEVPEDEWGIWFQKWDADSRASGNDCV